MLEERESLERFITDNPELERLEDLLADFNIFEVLKLSQHEIRHSNFLAWLLDPRGNHSLGDYFLKRLLSHSTSAARPLQSSTVTPIDIDVWDLADTIVFRESNGIDILLLNEAQSFVCAIENKIYAGEHSNQLSRYRIFLEQTYPNFKRHYILLSPEEDLPEQEDEQQHWVPISYGTICELLERTIKSRASVLSEEVRTFIHHYTIMLRRYILADSEIQQLAKLIYQRHRTAIDLIYELRPDTASQVRQFIENAVQETPDLQFDHSSKSYIHFSPKEWDTFPVFKQGREWTSTNRLLLFEFKNTNDSLTLFLVLGPGDETVRTNIFNFVKQKPRPFRIRRNNLTPKWTTLYRKDFLRASHYEDADLDTLRSRILAEWDSFKIEDLPSLRESIGESLKSIVE